MTHGAIDAARLSTVLTCRQQRPALPADKARKAAVLVPLVEHPSAGVLLTRRAESLRQHAGQVAFPGGCIDPEDAGPEAAALREAQEEIGLAAADVTVLGRLPCLLTGTGYHVTPVVALVHPRARFSPAADEVASVFVLPFSVLRDPAAPTRQTMQVGDGWREFWLWPHEQHRIWGATAAILVALAAALNQAH